VSLAIQQLSEQSAAMFSNNENFFRNSALRPDEIRANLFSDRAAAQEELKTSLDPQRIAELASIIAVSSRAIFEGYGGNGKDRNGKDIAERFADQAIRQDDLVQRRLDAAEAALFKREGDLNSQVQTMLQATAQAFQNPVNDFAFAVQRFATAPPQQVEVTIRGEEIG
jgi:hypothetical protein